MSIELLNWRSLTTAVRNIQVPGRIMIDKVFGKRPAKKHPTNKIDIDIIKGENRMAPLVSPIEGGVVVSKLAQSLRTVTAPRIREKKQLNGIDFNQRTPGATVYVTNEERVNAERERIALELTDLKDRAVRRLHWLCSQALQGKITVNQDNLNFEIDFLFQASHKPTLDANNVWTNANADPIAKFKSFKRLINQDCGGDADLCFFGTSAADAFLGHEKVQKQLNLLNVNRGKLDTTKGSQFIGNIEGVDIYEVAEQYKDDSGNVANFMPADGIILVDSSLDFELNYGAVNDRKAGGEIRTDWFSKTYEEEDPSALWLLLETNPLPVPKQPDAVVYATVI